MGKLTVHKYIYVVFSHIQRKKKCCQNETFGDLVTNGLKLFYHIYHIQGHFNRQKATTFQEDFPSWWRHCCQQGRQPVFCFNCQKWRQYYIASRSANQRRAFPQPCDGNKIILETPEKRKFHQQCGTAVSNQVTPMPLRPHQSSCWKVQRIQELYPWCLVLHRGRFNSQLCQSCLDS